MITVETPASFEWNDTNNKWVKNYLLPKIELLEKLTEDKNFDLNSLNEDKFKNLCHLLEQTADGRELRNKMFKAWRSKKSRDSDNGKKLYTFNLSIKAGDQLKKIAKSTPLNQTLESLIFAGKNVSNTPYEATKAHQDKIQQLAIENEQLKSQLSPIIVNDDEQIEAMINKDMQVIELAKLEKSQLIKQILMLKRKLNTLKD